MPNPQSPELRRSGTTDLDPDSIGPARRAEPDIGSSGPSGPVPEDNRPGHHPDHEQDQPPLDDFAARLGTRSPDDRAGAEEQPAAVTVRDPDEVVDRATARARRIADAADVERAGLPPEPGAGDLAGEGVAICVRAGRWGVAVVRYGVRSVRRLVPVGR